MRAWPEVALLIETSNAYARATCSVTFGPRDGGNAKRLRARDLLYGIRSYVREEASWSIYLTEHGRGETLPEWFHLRGVRLP